MQGGVWILAELFHTSGLQLMDVHIVPNQIGDSLIVTDLEIRPITHFSMVRKVLLTIFIDNTTERLTTVVEKSVLVSLFRVDAGYKPVTVLPIPVGQSPFMLLAMSGEQFSEAFSTI
jgi:K+ transporter